MPQFATSTSLRPGQSGDPRGRTPGPQRRSTIEVREVCNRLVDGAFNYFRRLMLEMKEVDQNSVSWNRIYGWLKQLGGLQGAA
jgi:hypothetical protein